MNSKKWVIFDLDGTLADIEERRKFSEKENGKMDWDKFFDPENIKMDKPNKPVIMMFQALKEFGYKIAIFSGRSESTLNTTEDWLNDNDIFPNILQLRPESPKYKWMPDEKLKLHWFNEFIQDLWKKGNYLNTDNSEEVVAVFDDRDKVVKMWREIGLTCMQVAPGDF